MFFEVQTLLAESRPRPRVAWLGYVAGGGVVTMLAMMMFSDRSSSARGAAEVLATVMMALFFIGTTTTNYLQTKARRTEQSRIEAAEELVQLRRWPQAAFLLQSILSRPTQTPVARLQALVYLSSVLARFHRFDDVIAIDDHLLETMSLEAPAVHIVKLAKAMALLCQDRLFDADRAISDLRRSPQAAESGGLAIVEIYRDVKTGHPAEAVEIFKKKRDLIRRQLGQRLADACILVAKAHDMLNQPEQAKTLYESATLLAPLVELVRRYPETGDLSAKYQPAPAPAEVAN